MLKLNSMSCAVDYATPKGLKHGVVRTNPYNACLLHIFSVHRVYKSRGAVLKVVPVTPVNFFTCLDWAVFLLFL